MKSGLDTEKILRGRGDPLTRVIETVVLNVEEEKLKHDWLQGKGREYREEKDSQRAEQYLGKGLGICTRGFKS